MVLVLEWADAGNLSQLLGCVHTLCPYCLRDLCLDWTEFDSVTLALTFKHYSTACVAAVWLLLEGVVALHTSSWRASQQRSQLWIVSMLWLHA